MPNDEEINELLAHEQRFKQLWEQIYPVVEGELAAIWTDEVKAELESLEKESEKIELILKHIKSSLEWYAERDAAIAKTISIIEDLIIYLKHPKSNEAWFKEVYLDISLLIRDIELIGQEYRVEKHQLTERLREILGFYRGAQIKDLVYVTDKNRVSNLMGETRLVLVQTGAGAVTNNTCEIMTSNLMGCLGIFIFGPNGKSLLHMTPKKELPYEINLSAVMKYIIESVLVIGRAFRKFLVVIFYNMYDNQKHAEELAKIEAVKKEFKKYGVKNIKIIELPLVQTLLYHSPNDPEHIFAIGRETYIFKGKVKERNKIEVFRIPIEPGEEVNFRIRR